MYTRTSVVNNKGAGTEFLNIIQWYRHKNTTQWQYILYTFMYILAYGQ
jgi:hypothetical protein